MRSWSDYKKTMDRAPTLHDAAKAANLGLIRALITAGAKLDEKDSRGYSPLMLAAYTGQLETVKCLITLGADVNSSDFAGNSILMGVAFKGNIPIAAELLQAGAELGARNHASMDALQFAVAFGRTEMQQFLLAHAENQAPGPSRLKSLISLFKTLFRTLGALRQ